LVECWWGWGLRITGKNLFFLTYRDQDKTRSGYAGDFLVKLWILVDILSARRRKAEKAA